MKLNLLKNFTNSDILTQTHSKKSKQQRNIHIKIIAENCNRSFGLTWKPAKNIINSIIIYWTIQFEWLKNWGQKFPLFIPNSNWKWHLCLICSEKWNLFGNYMRCTKVVVTSPKNGNYVHFYYRNYQAIAQFIATPLILLWTVRCTSICIRVWNNKKKINCTKTPSSSVAQIT